MRLLNTLATLATAVTAATGNTAETAMAAELAELRARVDMLSAQLAGDSAATAACGVPAAVPSRRRFLKRGNNGNIGRKNQNKGKQTRSAVSTKDTKLTTNTDKTVEEEQAKTVSRNGRFNPGAGDESGDESSSEEEDVGEDKTDEEKPSDGAGSAMGEGKTGYESGEEENNTPAVKSNRKRDVQNDSESTDLEAQKEAAARQQTAEKNDAENRRPGKGKVSSVKTKYSQLAGKGKGKGKKKRQSDSYDEEIEYVDVKPLTTSAYMSPAAAEAYHACLRENQSYGACKDVYLAGINCDTVVGNVPDFVIAHCAPEVAARRREYSASDYAEFDDWDFGLTLFRESDIEYDPAADLSGLQGGEMDISTGLAVDIGNPFDEASISVNVRANFARSSIVSCAFGIAIDGIIDARSVILMSVPQSTDTFPLNHAFTTSINGVGDVAVALAYDCSPDTESASLTLTGTPVIEATLTDISTELYDMEAAEEEEAATRFVIRM